MLTAIVAFPYSTNDHPLPEYPQKLTITKGIPDNDKYYNCAKASAT